MDRYTVSLDWKNQHCENDSTTQSNLQVQHNPYETTTGIFHRSRTINFTVCMETQKTPNSKCNFVKKKTELDESGSLTADYTTKLQ